MSGTNAAPHTDPPGGRPTARDSLANKVPDFREPLRPKYKHIILDSRYDGKDGKYCHTSISHRALSPGEDPRSDTDDEVDNEWLIQRHMDELAELAEREGWSGYELELRKRWDRHRMEEQLEHVKFIPNSLVRFVRKHRAWLRTDADDLLVAFFEFLQQLKGLAGVDDNVISDVNEMIFSDNPPMRRGRLRGDQQASREIERNNGPVDADEDDRPGPPVPAAGAPVCGECAKPIAQATKEAVFCPNPACATPGAMYHRTCAESSHPAPKRDAATHDGPVNHSRPLPTRAKPVKAVKTTKVKRNRGADAIEIPLDFDQPPAWSCRGCVQARVRIQRQMLPPTPAQTEARRRAKGKGRASNW
jgi:hypothetical protein